MEPLAHFFCQIKLNMTKVNEKILKLFLSLRRLLLQNESKKSLSDQSIVTNYIKSQVKKSERVQVP